jgi:hypothetical protein
MALITLARAEEQIPNFNTADTQVLTDILSACEDVIERYCNRTFELTTYDELYDGPGYPNLLLYQYPVTEVLRVAFNPSQVLQIRNTDQGVSRASFRIDGDTSTPAKPNVLYLVSLKNGVETDININLQTGATTVNGVSGTTYTMVTLNDLATAINGFSSYGWTALALGIYSTWPILDLRPPQGAFECRWFGNAYVWLHTWNLPDYTYNPDVGEITSAMGFSRGYRNFRVIYQAGYSVIPNSIQQAAADLTASVYNSRGQNPALNSESLGGYSYTNAAEKTFRQLDYASRYGLELYKNRRAAKFRIC